MDLAGVTKDEALDGALAKDRANYGNASGGSEKCASERGRRL